MIPTPIPTMIPTPVPTAIPTALPTMIPTPIPTDVPTAVPTEVPTPIPTEVPTPIPTEVPTPIPTEVPTPIPTEVPTAEPTAVPTEAPTEAPTAVPQPQLNPNGNSVGFDGETYSIPWYLDNSGTPFISLLQLSEALHWGYTGQGDATILNCSVYAVFDGSGVQALTVNGSSQASNAIVWNGDLMVNTRFLRALGLTVNVQSGWIMLETN